jgi:hypothetical protein
LWLRLSGVLLLRLAERTFCAWLFHEPPRNTRLAFSDHHPPISIAGDGSNCKFYLEKSPSAGVAPLHPAKSATDSNKRCGYSDNAAAFVYVSRAKITTYRWSVRLPPPYLTQS